MDRMGRYAKATAKPGEGDALAAALTEVAEGARQAPGCELYVVNRVPGEPDVVWVTEIWADRAAMDGALSAASADDSGLMDRVLGLAAEWDRVDLEPVAGVGLAARPAPGWARVRVDEVEDQGLGYGLAGIQEMRVLGEPLGLERTGISLQRLHPGQRQTFGHTHVNAEETYVVLSGSGTLRVGDEEVALGARDAVRVAPELTRAFEAGPDGLEYLAVGPRHAGDGAMAPGWWGD